MQFVSAAPLIEKFKNGTFEESEVGPYFMAYMIFLAVVWVFAFGEANPWDIVSSIASVIITPFGVLHLKNQNRDSFGHQFVVKYFSLGWVVTVRMLLLVLPTSAIIFTLTAIVGGEDVLAPTGTLFTIAFEILFYWWLGALFAQSVRTAIEPDFSHEA